MAEIQVPEFWKLIETKLSLDPNGIKAIKDILSLLNYTTIQSISKFTKQKEIQLIELEFLSRKKEFGEKYPHLANFSFGSGTTSILKDIATKVKNNFVNVSSDANFDEISDKILTDGKKVCSVSYFFKS